MKCPHCSHPEDHVIDSRPVDTASVIRRRRECLKCTRRFTTYERVESMPLVVLKSDDRREPFDRNKLREGLSRACEKRPVSMNQIEEMVSAVEAELQEEFVLEAPSRAIGDLVLKRLKKCDLVAYIRFLSVYKQFSGLDAFLAELQQLQPKKETDPSNVEIKNRKKTMSKSKIPIFLNVSLTEN